MTQEPYLLDEHARPMVLEAINSLEPDKTRRAGRTMGVLGGCGTIRMCGTPFGTLSKSRGEPMALFVTEAF